MTVATVINEMLYGGSPFDGFDASRFPFDLQGWFEDTQIFDTVIDQTRPSLIIEVGSWKGRSSHYLLKRALQHADASIICVDTWLGSSEHWINREWREMLAIRNGRPTLYEQFLANVIHAGLADRVVPLPLPARLASIVLQRVRGSQPDFAQLIFIDGAHDEASVREDIGAYWPLLSPGGVIIGDDYMGAWPGVIKAVEWFRTIYADQILNVDDVGNRWYAQKRHDAAGAGTIEVTGAHFGASLASLKTSGL